MNRKDPKRDFQGSLGRQHRCHNLSTLKLMHFVLGKNLADWEQPVRKLNCKWWTHCLHGKINWWLDTGEETYYNSESY